MPESIFQGTILCKFFAKGKCQKGEACKFAHGKTALKRKPDLSKTKICSAFKATGMCKQGEDCNFAHDRCEIRRNILKQSKQVDWDGLQLPLPTRSVTDPVASLTSVGDVDLSLPIPERSQTVSTCATDHPQFEESKALSEMVASSPTSTRDDSTKMSAGTILSVVVKNTFLHFEEETPLLPLKRSQSCPLLLGAARTWMLNL
mmetsp:Transcript_36830/g.68586  ORF Transcript_36830/g.68586 Transcript_36830/m.68586 type:complete len:203 (-) Transcript_36830:168-776(-)